MKAADKLPGEGVESRSFVAVIPAQRLRFLPWVRVMGYTNSALTQIARVLVDLGRSSLTIGASPTQYRVYHVRRDFQVRACGEVDRYLADQARAGVSYTCYPVTLMAGVRRLTGANFVDTSCSRCFSVLLGEHVVCAVQQSC